MPLVLRAQRFLRVRGSFPGGTGTGGRVRVPTVVFHVMRKLKDITGRKFGKLTVTKFSFLRKKTYWQCSCECGGSAVIRIDSLTSGRTISCGCRKRETLAIARIPKHGHARHVVSKTATYRAWEDMNARCNRPTHKNFSSYAGRGITVCQRWQNFQNFLEDMGERPNARLSLDRENNDGNYEPSNCRWATKSQQMSNRRRRK